METEVLALVVSGASAVIAGVSAFYSYRSDVRSKRAIQEASAGVDLYLEEYFKKYEGGKECFFFDLSISNPATRSFSISDIELRILIMRYSESIRTVILKPDKVDWQEGENEGSGDIFYLEAGQKKSFKVEFSASKLNDIEKDETKSYELLVRDTRGQISSLGFKLIRTK
ncbi:hypothetical protein ACFO5Q_15425 [Kordiimonas lipolytica]|uniref:Uncharacterized protein n=1 Tax=Kordiimonas lipolytica TaxID=1662421 RepID=A0ABV8UEW3_9PROT|nr:hypothetical protein [Kordiimonas lipolytica]